MEWINNHVVTVHVRSWELLVVLALVAYILYCTKKAKIGNIFHMILRLCYLSIVGSGLYMLISFNVGGIFHMKALLAVIAIGLLEMALIRAKKQQPSLLFLSLAAMLLVTVIAIGKGWIFK